MQEMYLFVNAFYRLKTFFLATACAGGIIKEYNVQFKEEWDE